jgi:hypothetical protein
MLSATAFEHLVSMAAAAAVSLAAFSASGRRPPVVAVVVLAAVLAIAGGARPAAAWWARRRALSCAAGDPPAIVGTLALLAALALCLLGWLVAGTAAWVLVEGLTAGPAPAFLFLLGAYTFAWLVGFIVPFAPSGLGVREATMIALLAPVLGAAPATALTVGLRVANVAGDFLAIGAIEGARVAARRWHRARSAHAVVWDIS